MTKENMEEGERVGKTEVEMSLIEIQTQETL